MKTSTTECCPPSSRLRSEAVDLEGEEADRELASYAKALGHPARVRIVRLLVSRGSCICGDIVEEFDLAQSTVSQHLRILKDAGLIRGEIEGPKSCYCIDAEAWRRLRVLLAVI